MTDDPGPRRTIEGACHCGTIRFTFERPATEGPIPVRACGCTFCRKHGGVYTSHPEGRLAVTISDPTRVTPYEFGTKTAIFHVCQTCGLVPVVTSEIDGRLYAVINVNCFEGIAPEELDCAPKDFDGESLGSRLSRRQTTWIPDVSF